MLSRATSRPAAASAAICPAPGAPGPRGRTNLARRVNGGGPHLAWRAAARVQDKHGRTGGGRVWTQALVSALGLFGTEPKSARQALGRTAAEGWLAPQRVGRQVRWSLTPPGQRLLSDGARRIYSFGREDVDWDGRWLLLLVSVPESQRDLRHRGRTQLNWAGFGSPAAGVWVSPHASQQAEGQRILADAGVTGTAMSFVASYGHIGSQDMLVARSWDLGALEQRYADFIDEFTGLDPPTGESPLPAP